MFRSRGLTVFGGEREETDGGFGDDYNFLKLKQQRSRDRREQILSAATKAAGERGIDGTSVTDIAAVAKAPLSSIYDYFETSARWCPRCPKGNFEALYQKTEPLLVKGGNPVEQLRIIFLTNFQYIKDNPSWGRVFFLEIWPSGRARWRAAGEEGGRQICPALCAVDQAGDPRRQLSPESRPSLHRDVPDDGRMCHLTAGLAALRPQIRSGEEGQGAVHHAAATACCSALALAAGA